MKTGRPGAKAPGPSRRRNEMEPEVTYTLPPDNEPVYLDAEDTPSGVEPYEVIETFVAGERHPPAKPKRARKPKRVDGPTEADFALVSGGPQWARGTFVKNGVVLRFDESGYAATDRATAEAVVSQHKEFRIV